MRLFFKILYIKWGNLKLWIHLNFRYPYKKYYANIRSIIPLNISLSEGIIIEKDVTVLSYLKEIGKNVYIGNNTHVGLCKKIGSFTSISFGVKIGLRNHPLSAISTSPVFYGSRRGWLTENRFPVTDNLLVEIGHDVLISANVIILEGVKVGTGSVIAAGAVVNKDVEPYSIVGGVPAKLIRYRFEEELRIELLKSRWWELEDSKLKGLINVADRPQEFLKAIDQVLK